MLSIFIFLAGLAMAAEHNPGNESCVIDECCIESPSEEGSSKTESPIAKPAEPQPMPECGGEDGTCTIDALSVREGGCIRPDGPRGGGWPDPYPIEKETKELACTIDLMDPNYCDPEYPEDWLWNSSTFNRRYLNDAPPTPCWFI